ncbi:hypothetical protein PI124_g2479 [Phytophthora idaei]|nr:hypothetical protein PI125_g2093 [Phytophthora idaei]KAG3171416.1 hypothetical protein PI126_g1903 [Phytophthora idaei]KAG3252936.1 hypothetical protein PI124_g2479 [Phytophthora idaei]
MLLGLEDCLTRRGRNYTRVRDHDHDSVGGDDATAGRDVGFGGSLYEYGAKVGFFFVTFGERYMVTVRNPGTLVLSPEDCAWVVLAMVFIVPIPMLRDYEDRFGAGGRLLCMWWVA